MKDRLMRVLTALGAVAAVALAGGASLQGFYREARLSTQVLFTRMGERARVR